MRVEQLTVDQLIVEYIDAVGHEGELDRTYLKKCFSDASDRVGTFHQLTHYVEIFNVKDFRCQIPSNFKYVIQAASRVGTGQQPTAREAVSKMTQQVLGTGCEIEISIKCPACHQEPCSCEDRKVIEVDANRIWQTANPKYSTQYMNHFYMHGGNTGRGTQSIYHDQFILMRTASGSFWNAEYHLNGCLNLRVENGYEYRVEPPNMIVNFQEGEVLVGYMGTMVDKDGYLTIPNTPQAIQAVVWYAAERMAYRNYIRQPGTTTRTLWSDMMAMREKHIGRAKNELRQWGEDEFWDWIENHWRKMIPNRNWRENLNRNTPDEFMFPDQTTNIEGYVAPYYKQHYGTQR